MIVTFKSSSAKEILGITFGIKLRYDKHIESFSKNASSNLIAIAMLANYINLTKIL